MLYRFLLSKKGYTFVEVLTVVIVLGILTAVGVPIFSAGLKSQKIKDCNNQRIMVQSAVQQAMYGMIDNGRKQDKIDFSEVQSDHKTTYTADAIVDNGDDIYNEKPCFVLIQDQDIPGAIAFTLSDLRGGYRDLNTYPDYTDGCKKGGNYLKKQRLGSNKFYVYLSNQEIPVCPFADYEDKDDTNDYRYYIFEDGTCICSCPECHSKVD